MAYQDVERQRSAPFLAVLVPATELSADQGPGQLARAYDLWSRRVRTFIIERCRSQDRRASLTSVGTVSALPPRPGRHDH